MKTEKRHSYGVLPIYRETDTYSFLVIDQIETSQDIGDSVGYWTFPKGTPENGETPLETAVRETKEEVGLIFGDVLTAPSFTQAYTFETDGIHIDKQVTYFLGFAKEKAIAIQETEIKSAEWLPYDEARERLTFEHTKELLDEVYEYLKNLDKA